jgi:hypothetical protein
MITPTPKQHGFTIVEMLLYSGILMIFLYIMTQLFSSILDMQMATEAAAPVAQDSRYILARFAYDIGRATDIVLPATIGAQSDILRLTINGDTYTYTVHEGQLQLTNTIGTYNINSFGTTVSNMIFRRYGTVGEKNSIRLAFTLTSATLRVNGPEVRNFQTTIGLR